MPDVGSAELPLAGVRVVALVETVPGPLASSILADLGADVLVVERPAGDPARAIPAVFGSFARNKRFVALDLRAPGDRARLHRELATAHVVLVGYRPDVARRLELDPPTLARRYPDAVIVSVTAAGDDEGGVTKPAHDLSVRAVAGQVPTGRTMTESELDGAPVADIVTGVYAALAAVAGLVGRPRGRVLGVSMRDAAFALNAIGLTAELQDVGIAGTMRAPAGYRTFRCRDGVLVAVGISYEAHHWDALCGRLGLTDLAGLSVEERIGRRDELNARLEAELATRDAASLLDELGDDLPVELVRTLREASALAPTVRDPEGGRHLASPIVVDGERLPVRTRSPGPPSAPGLSPGR